MPKLSVRPDAPAGIPAKPALKSPGTRAMAGFAKGNANPVRKRRRSFGSPINAKGLAVFTRQLATLVKAGMPILRSLEVLARQEKRPAFRAVIEDLADTIRSGGNFSDGLAASGGVFDRLYVNLVKAGEAGGVLDTVLERLAVFMEKARKITGRVKSAMIYPCVIVAVIVVIVSVVMVFVVPKFQDIFAGLMKGRPLPVPTQVLLDVANFFKAHFLLVGVAAVVVFFAFRFLGARGLGNAWRMGR